MGWFSPFRTKRAMAKLPRAQKSPTRRSEVRVGQDGKYVLFRAADGMLAHQGELEEAGKRVSRGRIVRLLAESKLMSRSTARPAKELRMLRVVTWLVV